MASRTTRNSPRDLSRSKTFNRDPRLRSADAGSLDEVIAHLSDATENRRARQITEWEKLRTQHLSGASLSTTFAVGRGFTLL